MTPLTTLSVFFPFRTDLQPGPAPVRAAAPHLGAHDAGHRAGWPGRQPGRGTVRDGGRDNRRRQSRNQAGHVRCLQGGTSSW